MEKFIQENFVHVRNKIIVELRGAGYSYEEIAERFGMTRRAVYEAYHRHVGSAYIDRNIGRSSSYPQQSLEQRSQREIMESVIIERVLREFRESINGGFLQRVLRVLKIK